MQKNTKLDDQILLETQFFLNVEVSFENKPQWESSLISIWLISKGRVTYFVNLGTLETTRLISFSFNVELVNAWVKVAGLIVQVHVIDSL